MQRITEDHNTAVEWPEDTELLVRSEGDTLIYNFPAKCTLRHEAVSRWRLALVILGAVGLLATAVLASQRDVIVDHRRLLGLSDGAGSRPVSGGARLLLSPPVLIAFAYFALLIGGGGMLARAWEQQSTLGRMLDPIADKMLILGTLIACSVIDALPHWLRIPAWFSLIVISRDALVVIGANGVSITGGQDAVKGKILRVAHLGTTSVRYEIGIFRGDDGQASAQGHFVHVYVDRATRRPTPLPAAFRQALERLQ